MSGEKNFKVPKNMPNDAVDVFLLLMDCSAKIRIMRDLLSGTKSFKQLSASTQCMGWQLKGYLKDLTEYGLIRTTIYPGAPAGVEYTPTQLGEQMKPAINNMAEWGHNYKALAKSKY